MTRNKMRRAKKVLKKGRLYIIQGHFLERASVACPWKGVDWEDTVGKKKHLPYPIICLPCHHVSIHGPPPDIQERAPHTQAAPVSCTLQETVGFLHVSI